ncbi:protein cueball isoform X5 [Eurytemora carolleeae]|uniref:protein cueball isoform X5 n=1 Tax=Eurytemora carolleeae TaxID=1294199 RepID=UPI000C77A4EC|nr:protein cueball isoform X5 [Eurytemora carolleeae]|eukprot:XP_023331602.1 protein cueball-like isoform X5 [Eurytemora affinis]
MGGGDISMHGRSFVVSLVIFIISVSATSNGAKQDVWVAVSNHLEGPETDLTVPSANFLTGIHGYRKQDGGGIVFLATDVGKNGAALFKIEDENITKLYEDISATYFESVVYSPKSRSIYLTSPSTHSIIRIDERGESSVVYQDQEKKPSGLAIDYCTNTIFWSNTQRGSATLEAWSESVKVGGADYSKIESRVLISGNLTRPRGVAVDYEAGHLYWTDEARNKFSIWRSNLNGSGRVLVVEGLGGEPFSLGVSETWISWSDWAKRSTWRIHKHADHSAELVKAYGLSKPSGIVYVPNQIKCDRDAATTLPFYAESSSTEIPELEYQTEVSVHPAYMDSYSIQASQANGSNMFCLEGVLDELDESQACQCNEGWRGKYCQVSVCENYCLYGECEVVEGNSVCFCIPGYSGDRCEISPDVTEGYLPVHIMNYLILILPILVTLQLIVIVVLAAAFIRYKRQPRIVRKRFISVTKPSNSKRKVGGGCGGGGGGGGGGLPTEDGIQLDIENCCNMTMCDTPCFEPSNRAPKDRSNSVYSPKKSGG